MTASRRQFTVAVVVCVAAAGLALYAASRSWLVEITPRPDPLPPLTVARTGGSLVPLLPALALVGLAGAGGLLATRGAARAVVGALLVVAGLGIPVGVAGVLGRAGLTVGWPVLSVVGGLAVAGVGVLAIRRGRTWPTMGSRYDRRPATDGDGREVVATGDEAGSRGVRGEDSAVRQAGTPGSPSPGAPAGPGGGPRAVDGESMASTTRSRTVLRSGDAGGSPGAAVLWDAIDRGEDPTKD